MNYKLNINGNKKEVKKCSESEIISAYNTHKCVKHLSEEQYKHFKYEVYVPTLKKHKPIKVDLTANTAKILKKREYMKKKKKNKM